MWKQANNHPDIDDTGYCSKARILYAPLDSVMFSLLAERFWPAMIGKKPVGGKKRRCGETTKKERLCTFPELL